MATEHSAGITRGQLIYAAARGDARAKATLKQSPPPVHEKPTPHQGSVANGRRLFADSKKAPASATTEGDSR